MTSIDYKATVTDATGRKREYELSIAVSNAQMKAFRAGSDDTAPATLLAATEPVFKKADETIIDAEPWVCYCGLIAAQWACHFPVMKQGNAGTTRIVMEDTVCMTCGRAVCEAKASRSLPRKCKL